MAIDLMHSDAYTLKQLGSILGFIVKTLSHLIEMLSGILAPTILIDALFDYIRPVPLRKHLK